MDSKIDTARLVFESWKVATNHPRSNMDNKRMTLILARLRDGYTEEDLTMAALGISVCPWNQGQNPDHKIFDSCELCFRNSDKVDHFIREGEQHIEREKKAVQHGRMIADAALRQSTMGDTYAENRGALLKLVKRELS